MLQNIRGKIWPYGIRFYSTKTLNIAELKLKSYAASSEIENSLELTQSSLNLDSLKPDYLLVKLVAAPINPADINIIQGKYGVLPKQLPTLMGNEGLFQVEESKSEKFSSGDWVLPIKPNWGTWRSYAIEPSSSFIKLPIKTNKEGCATLAINPITAYRMLHDFVQLKPNDTVIQNGANSSVGQAAIQFGKLMNINVVNIIRRRPELVQQQKTIDYLNKLGAQYVFCEDELRKQTIADLWSQIPKPRLALNCVGGKSTVDMIRHLDHNSTIVTYGGMSKQPLTFNTSDFIFKNLKACGFWLTRWRENNMAEFENNVNQICKLIESDQFKAPQCEVYHLNDFANAFRRLRTPYLTSKILLVE